MKKQTPETSILKAVCEYLEIKGYYFFRINNIPVFDPRRKCFHKMPKYSVKGVSDILVLSKGKAYFIEIKVSKTVLTKKTYQSPAQKEFEKNVKSNGCVYEVVRSVDDVRLLGF